ncbi:hypothetical protein N8I74_00340 [Chitiniphilus purpureus]|uniref:Alpha/beta hydrolase n=1 Tax=Chitiniphilus purpureus TaxID=2981137 RepID=A0ABY6DMC3_9NEIS|nr:hypothetical protein [Chitiniphilus sp. CD1]UXY15499.1 hypothetical protein N8I74_00340 [Chitiniphilus sp. CD1]
MKLKFLIASLLVSINSWAELNSCDQIPVTIHINGINTSRADAEESQRMLKVILEEKLGHPVKSDLAYNQTHGFFADIAQTFYQLNQQNPDEAPEKIAQALLYGEAPAGLEPRLAEAAQRYYRAQYERAMLAQLTLDEESEILRDIRQATSNDDKVLLVPHSQGNLFANRVYALLTQNGVPDSGQVRIFGVASPADRVLGNGSYLTSSKDLVIGGLDLLRNVLPSNIVVPAGDTLGHGFKETYLNPELNGREAVVAGLLTTIEKMNTSTNPFYADDPVLRRAPLVFSYYNTPVGEEYHALWRAHGWGGALKSLIGLYHVTNAHGTVRYDTGRRPPSAPLETVISVAKTISEGVNARFIYGISCAPYPLGNGAKLEQGNYEIKGDFGYASPIGQPEVPLGLPTGFSLEKQGWQYDYHFDTTTQQRSLDDWHSTIPNREGYPGFSTGFINLILGRAIVTEDEVTGRYRIEWQPTPELKATEIHH